MNHDLLVGTPGHAIRTERLSDSSEIGTADLYICSCGLSRMIERLPSGSFIKSEWTKQEDSNA